MFQECTDINNRKQNHVFFVYICQCIVPDNMSRPLIRGGGSRRLEASMSDSSAPVVGILGTGDFSRSLARRLLASGYIVLVGSRTPKRFVSLFPEEAEVTHNGTTTKIYTHYIIDVCVSPTLVITA